MEFNPITRPADDFQQGISVDELTAVCRQVLGTQTQVISARELGSGLFNSTYLIGLSDGQQVILRASPHAQAGAFRHEQHLLRREQALEPHLSAVRHLIPRTLAEWIFYYYDVPPAFWEVYGRPPTDTATQFRQLAYRGLYTIQLLLEATRFGWDAAFFWQTLEQVNREMEMNGK